MSTPYQLPMLFSAALPASPTASPEHAAVQPTLGTSGLQCFDWFASLGHDASLLRMCAEALAAACSTRSAATWNLRATRCSRSYILLSLSEHPTFDTDYSYWPTAKARDWRHAGPPRQRDHSPDLEQVVCWATLRATANRTSKKSKAEYGAPDSLCDQLSISSGSYLNPDWCELLMGFPPGWTSPDSRLTLGRRSTIMSRRARSFVRVSIIDRAFRRSAMPSSPSTPSRCSSPSPAG